VIAPTLARSETALQTLFPEETFTFGLIVAARVGGVLLFAPVLGSRRVPAPIRLGLVVVTTVALFPLAAGSRGDRPVAPTQVCGFAFLLLRELLIGVVLGYVASLILAAAQMAGNVLDLQIGFGSAAIFDPATGAATPILAHVYDVIASVAFITLDGHHTLLAALGRSWELLPIGTAQVSAATAGGLVTVTGQLLWVAVRIAAPGMAAAFLTDLGLGLIARGVPQMNVFLVGLPAKFAVGLALLAMAMPQVHNSILGGVGELARQLPWVLRGMAGPSP
jgi:flagellar biosynthetic protein FliR